MSWGLKGKTRAIREAEYYWDGEELDRLLIDINHPDDAVERAYLNLDVDFKYEVIDKYQYNLAHARIAYTDPAKFERAKLDIDHQHSRVSDYDYDRRCAELDLEDGAERKLALLEADHKHGKVSDREFALQRATLKEEPYIAVVKSEYDPRQGMNGLFFEFDWNDLWIDYLRLNGYGGVKEEELVEQWFTDLCRSVSEENPDEEVTGNVPFNSGRITRQVRRDGTSTEYS